MTLLFAAFAEKSTNNVIDFFLGTKWRFIRCHRNFKKSSSYEPIDTNTYTISPCTKPISKVIDFNQFSDLGNEKVI